MRLPLIPLVAALALAGCGPLSSFGNATRALDTSTLQTLPAQGGVQTSSRSLFVAEASAPAAISADRIIMKPGPVQITLLPNARWADTATGLVRDLLTRSLSDSGRLAYVTSASTGPLPAYTLMTGIADFQAQLTPESATPAEAVVTLNLSVVRNSDGRLMASRRFTSRVAAEDTKALPVVAAFDRAMSGVLAEAVPWVARAVGGQ